MTKAELVTKISENLGLEKNEVLATVENLMSEIKNSLNNGENVYHIPAFKPAKVFVDGVKKNN